MRGSWEVVRSPRPTEVAPKPKCSPYLVVNLLQGALGPLGGGADGSGIALHERPRGIHVEPVGTGGDCLHPIPAQGTPRTLPPTPQSSLHSWN